MKLLFVVPQLPDPRGGGALRMYSQLKYLAAPGVTIDLLCPAKEGAPVPEAIKRSVNKIYSAELPRETFARRLANLLSLNAYTMEKKLVELLKKALRENSYDLIHVHKFQMAVYLAGVKDVPVVVDLWACGLGGAWRDFLYEKNILRKLVKLSRLPRFYLADKRLYPAFKNFFVVSEEAAGYVRGRYPGKNVYVAPHGIELPEGEIVRSGPGRNLVFVGDMSFSPNVDTVLFFTEKIYPELKRRFADIRFFIVGRDPVPEVLALRGDASITVTGPVPDVGEFLRRADVFVAPIRSGSGLRTKLLEAFAYGLPVVTAKNACEGIDAQEGRDVVLAEQPEEYIEKIAGLLEDPGERLRLGKNARALAAGKYSWDKIAGRMKAHYGEILHNHNLKG